MEAKLLIDINRKALHEAEANGLTSIDTKTLHSIFDKIDEQLSKGNVETHPLEIEKFRSDLAGSLAHYEQVNNWNLEGFKQVIALGQSTLKSLMLINGAAVAILAFLGNALNSEHSKVVVLPFANSLRMFVFGVFLSAIAFALTYLSQLCYSSELPWHKNTGIVLHILTCLAGAAALVAFIYGANIAYLGFIAIGS